MFNFYFFLSLEIEKKSYLIIIIIFGNFSMSMDGFSKFQESTLIEKYFK